MMFPEGLANSTVTGMSKYRGLVALRGVSFCQLLELAIETNLPW